MRILIVDDHQLFIDGIRHIVTTLDHNIEIIEATSADEAWRQLDSSEELDLVLLDLHLQGLNGRSIMQHPRIQHACLPIVIISGEDNPQVIKSVIDDGVMGFIPKSYSGENLLTALRTVLDGDIYLPERLSGQLHRVDTGHGNPLDHDDSVSANGITKRQLEVLKLIADGQSNKQISNRLYLTENTVKSHVSALLRALNASNRTECVSIARSKGLIT